MTSSRGMAPCCGAGARVTVAALLTYGCVEPHLDWGTGCQIWDIWAEKSTERPCLPPLWVGGNWLFPKVFRQERATGLEPATSSLGS